jgi:tetratricopeptide (TPR) repeat protein
MSASERPVSTRWSLGIAIAAVAIVGAAGPRNALAQAGCSGNGKISKQIAIPMDAANKAMKARRWQEVLNKVREAQGVTGYMKSATDEFYMHEFQGVAYSQLKQFPEAARELEIGLKSPCMTEPNKHERYKELTAVYAAMRNNPKIIEYGNLTLKSGPDGDTPIYVAQAYFESGQNKDAIRVMSETIAAAEVRGQKPKEQWLLLLQSACAKIQDHACVSRQYEKLVTYYPKTDYWLNLTSSLTQLDNLNDTQQLNIMRLAAYVKVMKRPEQFKEMAQLALDQGLPCEAQTVLEGAFTGNIFKEQREKDVNTRLLDKARAACSPAKAALAQNEAKAQASTTGDDDVKVGAGYLTSGDAAKAVTVLQRGISKGKLANPDEAGILLGIAQLKTNNKAEAAKAFKTVKADPTMARIAKLWLLNT